MNTKQIRVLLLEDEAAHAEAIRRGLEAAGNAFKFYTVGTLKKYREHVATNPPDIALLDMVLPDGNGIDMLTAPPEANAFPMLILTSHGNEQAAVAALKAGALDYIVKSPETFANMPHILTVALNQWTLIGENKKTQQALQVSEENFRNSMENSPLGIHIISEDGETSYTNRAFLDIYGYKDLAEFKNTPVKDRYTPESYNEFHKRREKRLRREPLPDTYEVSIVRKDGMVRQLQVIRKEILWAGKPQYQTIYQDITERKEAEEALKAMTVRQGELLAAIPDIIMEVDKNKVYTWANQAGLEFFGDDVIGKEAAFYFEGEQDTYNVVKPLFNGDESTFYVESWQRREDGQKRLLAWWCRVLKDSQGNVRGALSSAQDITKHRQLEEAIKESEEKYRLIVEKSNDIVFTFNPAGEFLYVSPSVNKMLGYNPDDLIGRTFGSLVHPDDLPGLQQAIQRNIKDGSQTPGGNRYRVRHASGEWRWHNAAGNAVHDANGKFISFVAIARDITEHKHDEEALKESEEKYSTLVEQSIDGILILKNRLVAFANHRIYEMTGYSQEEILGKTFIDLAAPEYKEMLEEEYQRRQAGEEISGNHELEILTKDGRKIAVETKVQHIVYQGQPAAMSIIRDVSERKQAEEVLQESETRYHELVNTITSGVIIYKAVDNGQDFVFVDVNGAAEKLEGINRKDIIGKKITEVLPGSRDYNLFKQFQKVWRTGNSEYFSSSWRKDENDPGKWRDNWAYKLPSGEIVNVYDDITDKKLAEEALKASEQNFRNSIDTSLIGIHIVDKDWHTLYANRAFLDIYGYENIEELKASRQEDRYTPESYASWVVRHEQMLRGEAVPDEIEADIVRKDGTIRHVQSFRREIIWDGKQQYQLLYTDITERKQAEEALKVSEQNFRNSIDSSFIGINIIDKDFNTLYANQALLDIFGYKNIEELRTSPPQQHYTPESQVSYVLRNEKILHGGPIPDKVEVDIVRKDGVIRHLQLFRKEVLWDGKQQYQILYDDITERKQAEEALKASEQNFRNSMDGSTMGIRIMGDADYTLYVNQALLDMFGYKDIDEVRASPPQERYTPESYAGFIRRKEQFARGEPLPDKLEFDIIRKDGVIRHIQISSKEVLWNGKPQYQILYNDITERVRAEEALKASEQNFRNSLDNSPMGIRISDLDRHTLYGNSAFLEMFGYANIEEAGASPPHEHYTPEENTRFQVRKERALRGEPNPDQFEIDIVRKDGDTRHLQVFIKDVLWNGKQQHQVIYNDITERMRAEEALKASENSFRNSLDNSPIGIRISNRNDDTLYANQAFLNVFGYENIEELKASPPLKHYTPAAYADFLARMEKQKDGAPRPDSVEIEIARKDGSIRHLRLFTRELTWYGKQQFQNLYYDTTERRRAEEALKASEQNFRNSLDSSLMGVRIVDEEWHTLYANQVFLDIFGYETSDEVSRNTLQEHYTPEEYARYLQRQEKRMRGEVVPDYTKVDIVGKGGGARNLEIYSSEVFWDGKKRREIIYYDVTERKRAEEALKASEEKYSTLIEQSADGIVILNVHEIEFANRKMIEMFGFSEAEIIGKHFHDLVVPEYEKMLIQSENRKRIPGVPNTLELGMLCKDGRRILADTRSLPIVYKDRPARMVIIRDITERKRTEEELKASEQNFRNSIDSSSLGIRISDIDNNTLYANQTLLDIFGYKNIDEVIAKSPQDYYSPESYAEYLAMREKYGRGEIIPDQVDIDIIRKDGAVRHLQALFKIVLWNGKKQYQTQYNDITERKKMEEALRESEEKYRLIVENTRDIIFTVNAQEEYVYVSPSVKSILGYNQADLIGKPFLSLVHPEDKHIIEKETQLSYTTDYKTSPDNEYRLRHASGEWRWVVSNGTRVVDPSGKFLYFTGVIRDITASKQAEKEKQMLEEKAQVASRLAAVGEMAAGIAHEINNPLTGVLGFSQMLLENKNVPEEIKENIALIADGSQRVADIVKRLLTFARQSKPIKAVANINELIENTLKFREYVLKTNSIDVVTRLDPELPWSVVDPGQLQQVFLNLIVNAEQAMKKSHGKGTLTITTEKIQNNIRITFQDDGPGITRENLRHLFEPFFTTKGPGEGTGLGLSLSRSIILEHNGKMSVESEYSHGATFIVELPIVEALPSEVETTIPVIQEEKPIMNKGRILVVDDESGVRALLDNVLRKVGYSVDTIGDSRAAKDIIDAGTIYDVILLDIRMPGMSGIELYTLAIRKMPSLKNKIIFITGDVMGLDIRTFLNQNNLPYQAKPFDIELLKAKIDTVLRAQQT